MLSQHDNGMALRKKGVLLSRSTRVHNDNPHRFGAQAARGFKSFEIDDARVLLAQKGLPA